MQKEKKKDQSEDRGIVHTIQMELFFLIQTLWLCMRMQQGEYPTNQTAGC